ncbi:MAG: sterol desaturase family protein [Saezia sp.]
MNLLAFPVAFMLLFILAETFVLQRSGRHSEFTWNDVISNLNSGHVILWLFRGLEIFIFGCVSLYANTHWADGPIPLISQWPIAAQWIFAFIMWDFSFYVLHWVHHKVGLLRALHQVHHEGRYYNVSLAARNSWYSSLSAIPFFIWMAACGLPVEIFLVTSTLHYAIQLFNHNSLTPRLGFLEHIMVTPTHHKVHHLNKREYQESNYGGSFLIWDKLFGTFKQVSSDEPRLYGVGQRIPSENPLYLNHDTLFQWLKKPLPKRPEVHFKASGWLIGSAGVALFLVVILYVAGDGFWPTWQYYILLPLLAAGTIAIGGMSEGQYWGVWSWCLINIALTLSVLILFGWTGWYWYLLLPLLLTHSTISLLVLLRKKKLA